MKDGIRLRCNKYKSEHCLGTSLLRDDKLCYPTNPHTCVPDKEEVQEILFLTQLKRRVGRDTNVLELYNNMKDHFSKSVQDKVPFNRVRSQLFKLKARKNPPPPPPPLPAPEPQQGAPQDVELVDPNNGACPVCKEKPNNYVMVNDPCGHGMCTTCSEVVNKQKKKLCPVCKAVICKVLKYYVL